MSHNHSLLTILHSNIVSLRTNYNKLEPLIDTFLPDIIGLNETQIKADNNDFDIITTKSDTFDKNCHVKKRDNHNGPPISGSSLFTNSKSCTVNFQSSPGNFEIISSTVHLRSKSINSTIRLIYAYLSPSSSNSFVNEFYSEVVNIINTDKKSIHPIIIGDLNSKDKRLFATSSGNYQGKLLFNLINGYPLFTNGPVARCSFINNVKNATRFGRKSCNQLDVVLSSSSLGLPISIQHIDQTTDHDSILIKIISPSDSPIIPAEKRLKIYRYEEANTKELHNKIIQIRDNLKKDFDHKEIDLNCSHRRFKHEWIKSLNWKKNKEMKTKRNLNDNQSHKFLCNKLDILVKEVEISLRESFDSCIPHKKFTALDLDRSSILFPDELKLAYKQKSKLFNDLRSSGVAPSSHKRYCAISKRCSKIHEDFLNKWYDSLILPGRSSSREFYSKTRFLLGKTETKRVIVVRDNKGNMGDVKNTAKNFAINFSEKLKKNVDKNVCKKFPTRKIEIIPEPFSSDHNSFFKAIKSLNNKISCGFDEINNRLLKICPFATASLLSLIAKNIFELSHWPSGFKSAKSIVLHKKDDPNDANNFRVIALLSSISKVIEKVILEQLLSHFNANNLFYIRQAGYRVDNSCDDITTDLVDELLKNKALGYLQSNLFIDFTGAFDFMSIERLVVKLHGYGLLKSQVKLMNSYLSERNFQFVVNGYKSQPCWLSSGCSQGSCLGPVLFLIFINDLPASVKALGLDYLFADDVESQNKAKDPKRLTELTQRSAKRIQDWSIKNNCIVSIKKTKVMYIGKGNFGPIKIYNKTIEPVKSFKYLGNVIDDQLNGNKHLERIEGKVRSSLALANGLKDQLSLEKSIQIIQTFTFPLLTQGFKPMYPLMKKSDKDRWEQLSLEVQKASLRAPRLTSPHIVDKLSVIPSLSQSIKRALTKEVEKVFLSKHNSLIDKMDIQIPSQDNKKRKVYITPSHPKSGISLIASHVNEAKISTTDNTVGLYKDFKPKMSPPIIDFKLKPSDRIAIRNLSLGILSRLKMSSLDERISKFCTNCMRNRKKRKYIEDTPHLLRCSPQGGKLYEDASVILKIIVEATEKRLKTSSIPKNINQCKKLLDLVIFDDLSDIILGIGKVQCFKEVCKKKHKNVIEMIYSIQKKLIPLLKAKKRLSTSFTKSADYLFKDQASIPGFSV